MRVDWEQLQAFAPGVSLALTLLVTLLASGHAILHKRDARAATAWVGMIWLVPILGALLYLFLGINRIERRARELKSASSEGATPEDPPDTPIELERYLDTEHERLLELERVVANVTRRPLLPGNAIEILVDGDEAYPAMLEAIRGATRSLTMSSYIFETGGIGEAFVDALTEACARGVAVRVLIDDVGARYSWPRIQHVLERRGVPVARFLPALVPRSVTYFNLRNHRKIMVADGTVGFTGGMNIRRACVLHSNPKGATRDLHFRVRGPVVRQLQETFAEDWSFSAREALEGSPWFEDVGVAGSTLARGIADGPDANIDALNWVFLAAVGAARKSVRVMSPYFLPELPLLKALHLASKRGVEVDVIVPETGNLPIVRWAMWGYYRQVIEDGVRVWLTPPPFDHSKLCVVDRHWSSIGSTNWDPRSLRLNFEFNLECYDAELGQTFDAHARRRRAEARLLSLRELDRRSRLLKLRDGSARLFQPYL